MKRLKALLFLALMLTASLMPAFASAQMTEIDGRFSEELISELGYPLVEVHVGPDGVEAPSELAPGFYHVRLSAAEGFVGYMNIVQPPAGIDQVTEEEQMRLAGSMDLPQEGWTYYGGTNTPDVGETASFVIELKEGEYKVAASYYGTDYDIEEVYRLVPLTVSASATPVAASATPVVNEAPEAGITLEMTDDPAYIVSPDPAPAGPQIWKFENTGSERSHHIVMFRTPKGVASEDIVAEFSGMMSGTPPAEDGVASQLIWTGYGAMQSPGTVTWAEFDLEPGTYAVICFIMDDEQSPPHLMEGMVTVFTVQ